MAMNPNRAYPVERYRAAEAQGWRCWICEVDMVDRRACDGLCGPSQHAPEKTQMPRFNLMQHATRNMLEDCDQLHHGDPHAATYVEEDGTIRAAHHSRARSPCAR